MNLLLRSFRCLISLPSVSLLSFVVVRFSVVMIVHAMPQVLSDSRSKYRVKYRGISLRATKTREFCPEFANFALRQGLNRDSRRFPPKSQILLALALFLADIPKNIRDSAGIGRPNMELAALLIPGPSELNAVGGEA